MTVPDERYRAVLQTQEFLRDLLNPKKTPKVPKKIRTSAYWCLRHYPSEFDLERAALKAPNIFGRTKRDGKNNIKPKKRR